MAIEPGTYGVVRVLGGERAGQVGYYDDDDEDDSGAPVAVVYFGEPFAEMYELLPYENLEAGGDHVILLDLERWKGRHPTGKGQLGVG